MIWRTYRTSLQLLMNIACASRFRDEDVQEKFVIQGLPPLACKLSLMMHKPDQLQELGHVLAELNPMPIRLQQASPPHEVLLSRRSFDIVRQTMFFTTVHDIDHLMKLPGVRRTLSLRNVY